MWWIEGRSIRVWISGEGHVSFGGNAVAHQCRPSTDQWNETGQLEEASRVSKLPLEWRATIESDRGFEDGLSNSLATVGTFRRPARGAASFKVLNDFVSFSFQLSEAHFINTYDALKTYLASPATNLSYLLMHEFIGTRHPASDALVPTAEEFYRQEHPYVSEEPPSVTFVFGEVSV